MLKPMVEMWMEKKGIFASEDEMPILINVFFGGITFTAFTFGISTERLTLAFNEMRKKYESG